jgi:hypothetical protein
MDARLNCLAIATRGNCSSVGAVASAMNSIVWDSKLRPGPPLPLANVNGTDSVVNRSSLPVDACR